MKRGLFIIAVLIIFMLVLAPLIIAPNENAKADKSNQVKGSGSDAPIVQAKVRKVVDEGGVERQVNVRLEKQVNAEIKARLKVQNEEVPSEVDIEAVDEGERTRYRAKLSNGETKEIKILPDKAKQIASQKLNTEQVEMKLAEVDGEVVYDAEANKTGRFLWLFKKRVKVKKHIDPETGEVIRTKKPWWAVFVFGEDSEEYGKKVVICHVPPGDPDNAHTIEVGGVAVKAHLAKGSYLGPCVGDGYGTEPGDDDNDNDDEANDDNNDNDETTTP